MYSISCTSISTLEELTRYLYHMEIFYYISVDRRGSGRRVTVYTITLTVPKDILLEIKSKWKDVRIPEEVYKEI